jgi:Domain of unknown function (DUF4124)
MRRTFLLIAALTIAAVACPVTAQTAIRCDINGQTVYGDTPCPPGSSAKAVAPTQLTAEQKAAGQAANEQIRKDTAAVDKRLDDRYKRETARANVVQTAAASEKSAAKRKASKRTGADGQKRGVIKSKKASRGSAKSAGKKGGASYRPATP